MAAKTVMEGVEYFLADIDDPVNIVPVALVVFCFAFYGLPRGQHKALAWWALFNGCLIHCWMDGIVGTLGRGPKWMVIEYGRLDARYWPTKDPTVMMISAVELFIMGPLCLIWYNAIVKERWYCHFLSITVSVFQLMGCIIYVTTEAYAGFTHVPLDWPPKFDTFEKVFYFWLIYVGANIVWVVVPVLILMQTLFEMDVIYNKAAGNKKKMK